MDALGAALAPARSLDAAENTPQRLAAIVESSDDAILSKDLNGIILSWNSGAERLFGYKSEEVLGKSVTILIPEDHLDEEPRILERIRRGERVETYETIRQRKDGSRIDISLTVSPIRDAFGTVIGASKIARDISARKRAEAALARRVEEQSALYQFTDRLYHAKSLDDISESALDAILRAIRCERVSILLFDAAGVMRFVAWRGLSESYRAAAEGHSPWARVFTEPDPICVGDVDLADIEPSLKAAIKAEQIGALAFVPLMANDALIGKFILYYPAPHVFTSDEVDLALTIARELGFSVGRMRAEEARREAEAQRDLMVAELSHRVKNTLATIASIAQQSFSKGLGLEEARDSFSARIRALGQTHSRLAEANWSGVLLETLLLDEFAPYRRDDDANVRVSGPSVRLTPKQALTLGMAIHELTTNAAKYGALSTKSGKLDVAWTVTSGRLAIVWHESGGPPVAGPRRSGFGRLLLERALAADLKGEVRLDFAESGLKCDITVPLDGPGAT
jgi:PAS domain S-box-containing protein